MSEGGAWQSGVIDNGRDIQKGPAPAGVEAAKSSVPGVPAAMYNPPASMGAGKDGSHMPIISIALRCACILFCVIGFALIGSNEASYVNPGAYVDPYNYYATNYYYSVRAISNSSLAYLLGIDVIVCIYSVVQVILSIVNMCTGKLVLAGPTTPKATITFIFDQAFTYMLMAGVGAGAGATRGFYGYTCTGNAYCDKNAAAVAMSFLGFICIALSTAMAYFRVYKMAKI